MRIRDALRWICLLCVVFISQAKAGFTSIYAFGDGLCTTTDSPSPANLYHQGRRCNGKVWIETISQWQGITYNAAKNKSLFGYDSIVLNSNIAAFTQPADANSSLFIVWSANADFVKYASDGTPWINSYLSAWNAKISQSISNHTTAINALYNKGARVIIMPNAANVVAIPLYNARNAEEKSFIRDRVISFNSQFTTAMINLAASKGDLKIVFPDVFGFFEQVMENPALYGMVDPYPSNAVTTYLADKSFNGPGANYVFWDPWHPTAKFQMHLAAFIQQIITPVKVNSLSMSGGNVQLQIANIPLGRAGSIQGSANLQPPWVVDYPFTEPLAPVGNTTQTYSFPAAGPKRFYRVTFPVVWTWP